MEENRIHRAGLALWKKSQALPPGFMPGTIPCPGDFILALVYIRVPFQRFSRNYYCMTLLGHSAPCRGYLTGKWYIYATTNSTPTTSKSRVFQDDTSNTWKHLPTPPHPSPASPHHTRFIPLLPKAPTLPYGSFTKESSPVPPLKLV